MSLADQILALNNDLPIRTDAPVHSGKVRSVYWLTDADSKRLIQEKGYDAIRLQEEVLEWKQKGFPASFL